MTPRSRWWLKILSRDLGYVNPKTVKNMERVAAMDQAHRIPFVMKEDCSWGWPLSRQAVDSMRRYNKRLVENG